MILKNSSFLFGQSVLYQSQGEHDLYITRL